MASWWSHVYGTAAQGLQITIVGMALVFFTLGLIIVSMVLLTQLPGLRSSKAGQEPEEAPEEPAIKPAVVEPSAGGDELAQIAAIAVAVMRSRRGSRQPSRPAITATAWKQVGRARQLGL